MSESTQKQIEQQLKEHAVILYMKGSADFPLCGFSAKVVNILRTYNTPFHTINILEDEDIRQGIKIYSNWPTIPQLYVLGEFIGGGDIVQQMHDSGELKQVLGGTLDSS